MKNKFNWQVALIIGLIIFWIVVFIGFTLFIMSIDDEYKVEENGIISINNGELEISNEIKAYYDEENNIYYIEGSLINNTNEEYDNVKINYNVYDQDGYILGQAYDYITNLEGNGKWKFKVSYSGIDAKDVETYKFISIEAY